MAKRQHCCCSLTSFFGAGALRFLSVLFLILILILLLLLLLFILILILIILIVLIILIIIIIIIIIAVVIAIAVAIVIVILIIITVTIIIKTSCSWSHRLNHGSLPKSGQCRARPSRTQVSMSDAMRLNRRLSGLQTQTIHWRIFILSQFTIIGNRIHSALALRWSSIR